MSLFLLAQPQPAITAAVSGAGTEDLGQPGQPPDWRGLAGGAGVLQQDVRRPRPGGGDGGGGDWVRLVVLLGEVGRDEVVVLLAFCKSKLRDGRSRPVASPWNLKKGR